MVIDTFSLLHPNSFYAEAIDNYTFDILHGKIQLVHADVYVSPNGNNSNSGLTPTEPLKTIHQAFGVIIADSLNQHTIHLLQGTYSPSRNGEFMPVNLIDYVNVSGESPNTVIIYAEGSSGVMQIQRKKYSHISGFTLRGGNTMYGGGLFCINSNPWLNNISIMNNTAIGGGWYTGYGGGMYLVNSNPILEDMVIAGNSAFLGGGLYCSNSNPTLSNVKLNDNSAMEGNGGGVYFESSNSTLNNVSISGNSAYAGAGIYCTYSNPELQDAIISGNTAQNGGGM